MASKNNKQNTLKIYIAAVFAVFLCHKRSHSKTQLNVIEKDRFLDTDDIFIILSLL